MVFALAAQHLPVVEALRVVPLALAQMPLADDPGAMPGRLKPGREVGRDASNSEWRVVTPLRWLCWPVRIEARLGVHTEFVQKQLSTRRPRSAIASRCGVRVTTEP